MKFKLNQTVKIISNRKTDGRYNSGRIVGIEKYNSEFTFGYFSLKHFYDSFTSTKYKVAYQDCFNNKFCQEWFREEELDNK